MSAPHTHAAEPHGVEQVVGHTPHNPGGSTAAPGFGGLNGGLFGFPAPQVMPTQPTVPIHHTVSDTHTPLFIAGLRPKEKGATELLTYNTGLSYGSGLIGGGILGGAYGYVKAPAAVSYKLKLNSVINSASKYGGTTANSFAVFAIFFSAGRYISQRMRDGANDRYNDINGIGMATFASSLANRLRLPQSLAATAIVTGIAAGVTHYRTINAQPFEDVYLSVKPLQVKQNTSV